jgi:hypothetical protein
MIVEVLWFAGCCAVIVLGWRARKRPQVPLMRRAIVRLDLGAIRQKAAERHGWSGETAQALEDEYRDFLILIAENPIADDRLLVQNKESLQRPSL